MQAVKVTNQEQGKTYVLPELLREKWLIWDPGLGGGLGWRCRLMKMQIHSCEICAHTHLWMTSLDSGCPRTASSPRFIKSTPPPPIPPARRRCRANKDKRSSRALKAETEGCYEEGLSAVYRSKSCERPRVKAGMFTISIFKIRCLNRKS